MHPSENEGLEIVFPPDPLHIFDKQDTFLHLLHDEVTFTMLSTEFLQPSGPPHTLKDFLKATVS